MLSIQVLLKFVIWDTHSRGAIVLVGVDFGRCCLEDGNFRNGTTTFKSRLKRHSSFFYQVKTQQENIVHEQEHAKQMWNVLVLLG